MNSSGRVIMAALVGWLGLLATAPAVTVAEPTIVFQWPVPAGAKPSTQAPAGMVRLLYDPAVEWEAQALAARLQAAGLRLTTQARVLPRSPLLFPVLALPASRGADLGVFLWRTVPNQMPGLQAESGGANDELRLHAPVEPPSLAQGEVWILSHPSRMAEAQAIEAKFKPYRSANTLIETSVSWRGVIGPDGVAQTVWAPDPTSRGLGQLLRETGLDQLGPVQTLQLPERRNIPPDLVIMLRGAAHDPARGLTSDDLAQLGRDNHTMLLFKDGKGRKIEAAGLANGSLSLWGGSVALPATASAASLAPAVKARPVRTGSELARMRGVGALAGMQDLIELERGRALTEEELARLRKFWAAAATGRLDEEKLQEFIATMNFFTSYAPELAGDETIAAQMLSAHRWVAGDPGATGDLEAQINGMEAWLAQMALEARQAGRVGAMPAIYRAAAERVVFDRYTPLLQLPVGTRPFEDRSRLDQLMETADLMERYNGGATEGAGPSIALPEAIFGPATAPLYGRWVDWPALRQAAASGNLADTIHFVNQLVLALRVEFAAREPAKIQSNAEGFNDLLVKPVRT